MYQSTKKMKLRDKRLKRLLCVQGPEIAGLRKVPLNRDLTNQKNHAKQREQPVQRLSSGMDVVHWRDKRAHTVPAPCRQGQGFWKWKCYLRKGTILNIADSNSPRSYLDCAVPAQCLALPPARSFHSQEPPGPGWPPQAATLLALLKPPAAV